MIMMHQAVRSTTKRSDLSLKHGKFKSLLLDNK